MVLLVAALPLCGCDDGGGTADLTTCWSDATTGLCWQDPPRDSIANGVGLAEATSYCASIGDGWRVPTVDELRSLVRGCDWLETGGGCALTDPGCLNSAGDCLAGCDTEATWGDGPGQDGYYQPAELAAIGGNEMVSASRDESPTCGDDCVGAWYLDFRSCSVGTSDGFSSVRCVRDTPF